MDDERLEIIKQQSYKVVKANEIIQKARYELSLPELKILAYLISMIKPTDQAGKIYELSIGDYCKVCGIDFKNGKNYIDIKKMLKGLRDKSFYLQLEDGSETTVGWINKVWIKRRSGKIQVEFDRDLQKYLIGLFENYTQYELLCTLPMRSQYSFRLYELLKSYAYKKYHTFDIEDLKIMLNCTNYINFKDFRKKVIEIAMKEINLYSDIEVNYEPIYKGRKVVKIKFDIRLRDSWGLHINSQRARKQLEGQIELADIYEV